MRLSRTLALGASMLVLIGACTTGGGSSKPTVKIGSDGFDEARVVAEAYAQVLEAAGYTVDRAGIGLGARKVTAAALESAQIDVKPEYIGSGLVYYGGASSNDPAKNKTDLQAKVTSVGGGLTVFGYTAGQDTNALVVTKATADKYKLTKWSDLTAVQAQLKWGLATDCPTNPVCSTALKDSYGIDTTKLQLTLLEACSTPMSDALKAGTVDVAELCSTGPEIIVNGWVRLEDDKKTQPADAIAPLVRNDLLAKVGDKAVFQKLFDDVSAKIDTATLADLYKQVAVDKKDTKVVASTWLKAQGLVK
ncbi:MAG TPA: glycine betaine ABC transporter substrate-binding protein [Candidatus Limnocylindrales bacterium]|nr:glycine betaine ABC transporter substrate-binding protein [Candidatus Limnocylindrales bacterium]